MPELADRVLRTIRRKELIAPGDRVAVAVSGGADSLALLLILIELRSELGIVLSVAHVNHKLRGQESDEDEQFVSDLAQRHKLDFHVRELPLPNAPDSGIEAAARELRYAFFRQLMVDRIVSKVATAHTIDDQAETVLLRILRGTGLRGLAGIHPRLQMKHEDRAIGEVVRPVLSFHHNELESYLCGQQWREDSSNRDPRFSRNRIRHRVLPLLKHEFGEGAVDNLAGLAEIARADDEHWNTAHPEVYARGGELKLAPLQQLSLAAQRRLVRNWLEDSAPDSAISYSLIEEVLDLAIGPAGKKLELPGGRMIRRAQHNLRLETAEAAPDYEYRLTVPGHIDIVQLNIRITANLGPPDPSLVDPSRWLDPSRLQKSLIVRNWRPGDRFWPAHRKEPRKIKELLSERHLTGREKQLWPVVVAENIGLIWMRGFPIPQALRASADAADVLYFRETPIHPPVRD